MRAHVEENFATGATRVWLFEPREGAQALLHIHEHDEIWRTELIDTYAASPQPSFVLPHGALTALLEAAQGYAPPEDSTRKHLEDAVGIRDRLFDLVEELV